ncbi:MFS transporter [Altererythrobacter xixiisoli]|uniref:MFS transporter n=1 Tax=Croceibacterium xixiisoli TaxID=1476466 RepID=A0A6I4TRS0_9SPHN|nr:MFS transporter [Croceibacterium xixiisoli]MXO98602.1 MFS transporter [Croceibacterium xixiisoli]
MASMTGEMATPTRAETIDAWPAPWRGWLLVGLLALASIVSQFDRTVINLMVEPIKAEFGLNDTAFGALQSVAFGIFYVLACIPLGRMADNHSRKNLIAICLFFWSIFACASGLARSYAILFLTRIGVAVGEASLTPAGLSMLADHFPPEKLGRPVSGFLMSAPMGQGLAFIGGGSLLTMLAGSSLIHGGMLDGFAPWQAAFLIVGAPGLLLVPLFLLCREPARRGAQEHALPPPERALPAREVVSLVGERWRALVPMFIGFAMVLLVAYSVTIWAPALFQRSYGWDPARIGLGFGLALIIAGTAGVYVAGLLSDRLAARGHRDAPLKVAAGGFAIGGVCGTLAPLMPSGELALALLAATLFFCNMPFPCAATSLQLIVPNRARAQVSAIYVTFTTLVGLSVGPTVIGLMTDYVFRDPADIRYSMSVVIGTAAPIMVVMLLLAMPAYRRFRGE